MRIALLLVAILGLSACNATSRQGQVEKALLLSKNHFYNSVDVQDDDLDTVATVTTVRGLQEKHGLVGVVRDDNFIRAFIDKKTGTTTYQIYQIIYYTGQNWNFFNQVNYETPNGPVAQPVDDISRDVNCSGSRFGGCTYVEHIAFTLDPELIALIAANYAPGQRNVWRFKYKAKSGQQYPDGMLPAEVAGLFDFVRDYKASRGLLRTP